ncbi:hypothetical protein AU210_016512 [Fusarium oxysporum f. sp. radicis-cucumerinum]|uniref:BZIP domain-containing protein n=1 Tax=Fusarium oxysporum f. sp. radicis-cucumerinum TaxID=327505 RepID=A0A2H3FQD2_FUSOX|nr:hypothetical protein AU210_016512 [Fusarium oxysporum f. sp. radicis-cucumerinum]
MSPLTEANKLTIHSVCGYSRATGKSTHWSSTTTYQTSDALHGSNTECMWYQEIDPVLHCWEILPSILTQKLSPPYRTNDPTILHNEYRSPDVSKPYDISADAKSNRRQLIIKEAIDASPVPMGVGVGSTYNALPTQPAEFKNLRGSETLQNILPSVMGVKKLNGRAHTRSQSQANEVLFESSASGQAAESPKPRKRGRKPKKQLKEQKVAGQHKELDDDDDLPKDPRRRRVLERNRIAANKCRLRKRDEALALASREETMEDQNRYLMTCFDSLTVEIYHLKTQLLRHTECNCVLIQNYIANKAQKCVDRLVACSTAFDTYGNLLRPCDGSPSDASTAKELNTQSLNGGGFPATPRISSQ